MIFRGQLQRIHDYLFHIAVAVVIFIIGFIIVYGNLPKPQFDQSAFANQQQSFQQCVNNDALFNSAQTFEKTYLQLPLQEISAQYKSLRKLVPVNCGSLHAESSYEQLQEMALPVLAKAQAFFNMEDVKAVNAVYTPSSAYSALLDTPQPYLFFISDKEQERIVAIKVSPSENGPIIEPLWNYEESQNLAYTQGEVQKLLLVYNEIKR
ncbi:hypothetical protein GCM10007916_27210 [Psychromonas marina]|uniref:DUF302 domain-containing protein n=1 Tax=Psychromonas marina TaxID=88364 RepID=A0ABQ6E2P8_9GAMM|nr:hypothetical protein [Psychromonas marina]GLS91652.1 hypothetical protein GCM10007916_27210 [Psychromonas marina]